MVDPEYTYYDKELDSYWRLSINILDGTYIFHFHFVRVRRDLLSRKRATRDGQVEFENEERLEEEGEEGEKRWKDRENHRKISNP